MRRHDREIGDFEEIVDVIRRCDVCRLALNDGDYPYIVPLNFGLRLEDGEIVLYFHSATSGKKLDLMARDNRASFEMDCGHELVTDESTGKCTMRYASVIGRGIIEPVPEEEKVGALRMILDHYHEEDFPVNLPALPATRVFRLRVTQVTGKANRAKK